MMTKEAKLAARKVWVAYEQAYVARYREKPGSQIPATPLEQLIANGDEKAVDAMVADLKDRTRQLLEEEPNS